MKSQTGKFSVNKFLRMILRIQIDSSSAFIILIKFDVYCEYYGDRHDSDFINVRVMTTKPVALNFLNVN